MLLSLRIWVRYWRNSALTISLCIGTFINTSRCLTQVLLPLLWVRGFLEKRWLTMVIKTFASLCSPQVSLFSGLYNMNMVHMFRSCVFQEPKYYTQNLFVSTKLWQHKNILSFRVAVSYCWIIVARQMRLVKIYIIKKSWKFLQEVTVRQSAVTNMATVRNFWGYVQ